MNAATFFLSTGRCGTQWLARNLRQVVGSTTTVRHEPIYLDYWPRQLLATGRDQLPSSAGLDAHLDYIEQSLRRGPYIECGWPCYGAVPYLLQRFAGRIRIVHLIRHPASTAYSLTTHGWYSFPPRFKSIAERGELTPFDASARLPHYGPHWENLSTFEKCLYFWAEIQCLGLALQETTTAPWLRIRYEDIFLAGDGLASLAAFLDLPDFQALLDRLRQREDRVSLQSSRSWDQTALGRHPDILRLAELFGYDPLIAPEGDLRAHFALPERRQSGLSGNAAVARNAPCPCGSGLRYKSCHGRGAG